MARVKAALLGLAALAVLTACAGAQPSGKPLVISQRAYDHLQKYMREVAAGRAGAFAIAENGRAAHYTVCESGTCNGQYNFSSKALKGCESAGSGRCVILASNGVIKRPYTVGDSTDDLSAQLQALLSQQAAPLESPDFVSGDRIRQELIGNSFIETNAEGKTWAEYYDPNGTVRGHNWRGKRFAGTWKIDGDRICVDYTSIGSDWCAQFAEGDDGAIKSYEDGRLVRTYPRSVLQAGNPEGL